MILHNVWEEFLRVEIHGMSPDRFEDRHACLVEQLSQVPDLPNPEAEIVFVQDFAETSGHRFQVTASQTAIGGKAFDQDEHVGNVLRPLIIVQAEKSPDV